MGLSVRRGGRPAERRGGPGIHSGPGRPAGLVLGRSHVVAAHGIRPDAAASLPLAHFCPTDLERCKVEQESVCPLGGKGLSTAGNDKSMNQGGEL